MKRLHISLLVPMLAVLAATMSVAVVVHGCGSGGPRLGDGTTVNLNQLWGMVAQEAGAYASGAILVELEMALSPVEGMPPPEQTARIDNLQFMAWAHGRGIQVNATWPKRGLGELSMETLPSRNDPMPEPVGYPLAKLSSRLDYIGMAGLLEGLGPYTDKEAIRLRLVYPPSTGPYGQQWNVPLLVLRGRSVETAMSLDFRTWATSSGVFQVLAASSERLLAILVVEEPRRI